MQRMYVQNAKNVCCDISGHSCIDNKCMHSLASCRNPIPFQLNRPCLVILDTNAFCNLIGAANISVAEPNWNRPSTRTSIHLESSLNWV